MLRTTIAVAAGLALAATLPAISAHAAARARVFVASYGSDSNTCTFGSPCKTFQHAVDVVAAGGEVTAIDSAGFGPIVISHAVTITSPAGVEAGIVAAAGGDAIDINAGSTDAIILRGLTLNGSGTAYNGVVFNSGGSLTVSDCVVENFAYSGSGLNSGLGIVMQPGNAAISFAITNTIISNNGYVGLGYNGFGTANGVIDHVAATNNRFGINIVGASGTNIAISNSIASDNSDTGIEAQNAAVVSIDNSSANNNQIGIDTEANAIIMLSRSVVTGNNNFGVFNDSNGPFYSLHDNRIYGNQSDGTTGLTYTRTLN